MNRYASIDIGTNTVLMVVADISAHGEITPVFDFQQLPRLGKGVDAHRKIPIESVNRVVDALTNCKDKAHKLNVSQIFACGTSALRDAQNSYEVIDYIKNHTGISIDIISGEKEAEFTYLGALSGIPHSEDSICVIDIGGGSTELVIGRNRTVDTRYSVDIGCVRITERYFNSLPPSAEKIHAADRLIEENIRNTIKKAKIDKIVGVAGTVTTLAAIYKEIDVFSPDAVDGVEITFDDIDKIFSEYATYSLEQMKNIPQVTEGREDILLAGILILRRYLKYLGKESIIVSSRGLRYGQLIARAAI